MKYHVKNNGEVGECRADVQDCPLTNVEHFENLQEANNYATMVLEDEFPVVGTFKKDSPMKIFSARFGPFSGGRYYGCHMDKNDVRPYLDQIREIVGEEKAAAMGKDKAARDRGYVYHTTVIRPQETKAVQGLEKFPESFDMDFVGLGRVDSDDGKNEAWFLVVNSPDAQKFRESVGLPPHDLHVTLAFLGKDVHNKSKGQESLI